MGTKALERFAQTARRQLLDEVGAKLEQVLAADSAELREKAEAIQELRRQIKGSSRQTVIDRVAYTWFNRFCALRFMDANHYTRSGIVSPLPGHMQPEILQDAKQGHIGDDLKHAVDVDRVFALLSGELPSSDPQGEAYRLLLVGACNSYHKQMPFLFERINDHTELLMPDDLLSEASILHAMREAMSEETCQDVEVIGWLYQYYISEKKAEVDLKVTKGGKVTSEELPAKTSLFTPHWIVRYLIENSLGRLWMLNHPGSKLTEGMEYYIDDRDLPASERQITSFLRVSSPEEIKVCDPACGSGHMLTYAFDLLHAIYEEQGYDPREIPCLILTKNLTGIEIDERAGALAAFALAMKAREKDVRFFSRGVQPEICVLEDVSFSQEELAAYMDRVGRNLFTAPLQETLEQFNEAKHFGSLIRPIAGDVSEILRTLRERNVGGDIFLNETHQRVLRGLSQAEILSDRYHIVVANPPYLGRGMNAELKDFARKRYPDTKSDLFAMFIERNLDLVMPRGAVAMITMQSWMFITSYERIRKRVLESHGLLSMAHLGARAFDSIGGEVVSTTAFIVEVDVDSTRAGSFLRLVEGRDETEKREALLNAVSDRDCGWFFRASNTDFKKIPGSPIAYWIPDPIRQLYEEFPLVGELLEAGNGLQTNDNESFLRLWHEIAHSDLGLGLHTRDEARESSRTWFPYNKGGIFRKWFGNHAFVVNWRNDGEDIKQRKAEDLEAGRITPNNSKCWNEGHYFRPAITWSDVTTGANSFRLSRGSLFDITAPSVFPTSEHTPEKLLALLNSVLVRTLAGALNPTMHFNVGNLRQLPAAFVDSASVHELVAQAIGMAERDWDAYENSWNFRANPLLAVDRHSETLELAYHSHRTEQRAMTSKLRELEEKNNRLFIDAFGLQDELAPDVPIEQITLTVNPAYRYGKKLADDEWSFDEGFGEELEARFLKDTMEEFISYAVGCMLGRYSLDRTGLILANQGDTIAEYLEQVPESIFMPDEDNVIPILGGDWFTDDIVDRFCRFLRTTLGDEHYQENLAFLESAIGRSLRKYFLKDFYKSHVQRYKKRPIYWLFASPKGSFNALIYMHRYTPDTVSIVLNDYLREFRAKLASRREHLEQISISSSASSRDKSAALKEIEKLRGMIEELDQYESEILYPLATQRIEIDLDDGVKVNYNKLGKALQKVPGLST